MPTGREGGKKKPLKAPKKEKREDDDVDRAFHEKQRFVVLFSFPFFVAHLFSPSCFFSDNRAEAAEVKRLQKEAAARGPLGKQGGISKSGKKKL